MAINITLIGTDEDVPGASATLATLATKTGYVTETDTAYQINRKPIVDVSEEEFLGNITQATKNMRFEMEIKLDKRAYSQSMTAVDDDVFFPETKILKKPFLWVYSDNYKIGFTAANTAIKVTLQGLEYEKKGRYLVTTIKFEDSHGI